MNFYHLMQEAREVRSNILVLLSITMLLAAGALLALGFMLCMYCHGRYTRGQNPTHYRTPVPLPCVCCEHAALHDQQVGTLSVGDYYSNRLVFEDTLGLRPCARRPESGSGFHLEDRCPNPSFHQ